MVIIKKKTNAGLLGTIAALGNYVSGKLSVEGAIQVMFYLTGTGVSVPASMVVQVSEVDSPSETYASADFVDVVATTHMVKVEGVALPAAINTGLWIFVGSNTIASPLLGVKWVRLKYAGHATVAITAASLIEKVFYNQPGPQYHSGF
jgi:hypothetical protein